MLSSDKIIMQLYRGKEVTNRVAGGMKSGLWGLEIIIGKFLTPQGNRLLLA
jgi:hypothetical protein